MVLVDWLAALSGFSFLIYGLSCLQSRAMAREFERFGLARFRTLTGLLEVFGGVGSLIGVWYPPLLLLASGGLTVLMVLGVAVRLRVRDGLFLTLPALVLCVVNGYVAMEAWRRVVAA